VTPLKHKHVLTVEALGIPVTVLAIIPNRRQVVVPQGDAGQCHNNLSRN
jgi:hypothetical protein